MNGDSMVINLKLFLPRSEISPSADGMGRI